MLTVLSVAYPLAPVGRDAAGGAEQVLRALDAALVRAGHRSLVVACTGSTVAGTLLATPAPEPPLDAALAAAQERHAATLAAALAAYPVDLVHCHGLDFDRYLPAPGVPLLATLHLPPSWYSPSVFELERPRTFLHGVSAHQHRQCPPGARLLSPIPNGVPVRAFASDIRPRSHCVVLGRVCPEKGIHHALDAARLADCGLLVAGSVFAYPDHERYFSREVVPRLDRRRRFIGPVGFAGKRRLLASARALLVPSLAPETSSLVAMEALACGTPVIAFDSGALPDIVEPGVTGFVVHDAAEMAEAIVRIGELDREACVDAARRRFDEAPMTARYLALYEALAATEPDAGPVSAGASSRVDAATAISAR